MYIMRTASRVLVMMHQLNIAQHRFIHVLIFRNVMEFGLRVHGVINNFNEFHYRPLKLPQGFDIFIGYEL